MLKNKRKNIFIESLQYIRESKSFIIFAVVLFLLGSLIGVFFTEPLATYIDPLLEKLVGGIEGKSLSGIIWFIFKNNSQSALFSIVLGIALGIFPFITASFNGVILGYVFAKASAIGGLGVIWYLIPHGIFELPAIFISMGLGFRLGMFIFAKDKRKAFIENFYGSMKAFLTIVLPLLIVAAIIEGFLIVYWN